MSTMLCSLARKYGTDKGGEHLAAGDTCHEYTKVYDRLLHARRQDVKHMLEVGVNTGASLRMWEEYFPNADIVGLDIWANSLFNEGRIRCFLANQTDAEMIYTVMRQLDDRPRFDLIIDDGSHELHDQVRAADILLPFLAHDGLYVVEDLTIDCEASVFLSRLNAAHQLLFAADVYDAGRGIGRAHCGDGTPCPHCNGHGPEQLVVLRRR